MLRRTLLLTVFILAACNAQPPPTDSVFLTATANPIFEPPPQNQSLGGTSVPSEFTGGDPQLLSSQHQFEFSISGDVTSEIRSGTAVYNFIPATGGIVAHDQIYLASSSASSSEQVSFQFRTGLVTGEYALTSPQNFVLGVVTAQYARLSDDGSGSQLQVFSEEVTGTLTLTAVGEALSGEFQFTASYVTDDGSRSQVEVSGSFADIPYHRSGDPFEVDVPLPTRNFTGTDEP